jgi:hypothetical protein
MIEDDFLKRISVHHNTLASPLPTAKGGLALSLSVKTLLKQWLDAKLDEIRAADSVEETQQLIDALPPQIAECISVKSKN